MKKISAIFRILILGLLWVAGRPAAAQVQGQAKLISVEVASSINPATAGFIRKAIDRARKEEAQALLIRLNTPGGLLKSTRVIVSDILESPVPVIVYVAPGGAHAGSAGVFITMAAHIAAMAPGTNIGAAHPVSMEGGMDTVMNEKATNDAAAFIRSIAEKRNRNLEWAEEAVRKSVSITEVEAVDKKVVDLIANDESDLLRKLDGRRVTAGGQEHTLSTANASVVRMEMGLLDKFLNLLADPNIAYILMMLGMYGILFELYSPGAIFPGVIGGICLILAFYAMHTLPVNYAGLALIIFGVILLLLEIKVTSYGMLSIGGILSLLLGSFFLFDTGSALEVVRLSWTVILLVTGATAAFFLFVAGMGLKAQSLKPVTGEEGLIGATGTTVTEINPRGVVLVRGERWNAESRNVPIAEGKNIVVKGVKGLTLYIEEI